MARKISGHKAIITEYGDGYYEPRSASIECACGAHIWDWMQYYAEAPDWEQNWLDHLAVVQHWIDPTPIYAELADDYEIAYSRINKELTDFERIDFSIPGARHETADVF